MSANLSNKTLIDLFILGVVSGYKWAKQQEKR